MFTFPLDSSKDHKNCVFFLYHILLQRISFCFPKQKLRSPKDKFKLQIHKITSSFKRWLYIFYDWESFKVIEQNLDSIVTPHWIPKTKWCVELSFISKEIWQEYRAPSRKKIEYFKQKFYHLGLLCHNSNLATKNRLKKWDWHTRRPVGSLIWRKR